MPDSQTAYTIDAHQHIWQLDRSPYAWLRSPGLEAIDHSIRFEDGYENMAMADVVGSVLVQADDTDADTDLMLETAAADPRVVGVVGWVPLDDADAADERLARIASPALVGIRALIHDLPDPDWILRPEVNEGLALLEARGLSFDVVAVLPRHLENAITIGQRHPDLRMVIDHLAKPPIGVPDREPWWSLIARVAENPLITAKVSGLYSATADVASWTVDEVEPFVERALEVFGAERLMYGSDWPFSIPAGGFDHTWPAFSRLIGSLAPSERASLLGGTATRHYRLDARRIDAAARAQTIS